MSSWMCNVCRVSNTSDGLKCTTCGNLDAAAGDKSTKQPNESFKKGSLMEVKKGPSAQALYAEGLALERHASRSEAATRFKQAAEHGHGEASYKLAEYLIWGMNGTPIDYKQAVVHLLEAAALKSAHAPSLLGWCYYWGHGTTGNQSKGLQLWTNDISNPYSQFEYAEFGTTDNTERQALFSQCISVLQKMANSGDARAQCTMGVAYYCGRGVSEDQSKAATMYKLAADQGHAGAQSCLSCCYQLGEGVPLDKKKALQLCQAAFKQGKPKLSLPDETDGSTSVQASTPIAGLGNTSPTLLIDRAPSLDVKDSNQPEQKRSSSSLDLVKGAFVFWDIENCAIPSGVDASDAVKALRDAIDVKGEVMFTCYCDAASMTTHQRKSFAMANVTISDIPIRKPGAADMKIATDMIKLGSISERKLLFVLISGDSDFAAAIHDVRNRSGHDVLLIHNNQARKELVQAATKCLLFASVMTRSGTAVVPDSKKVM